MLRLLVLFRQFVKLVQKDIWQPAYLAERSFRGAMYATLRVISITWTGLQETRATSRAAALAFSSLLGIGPLIGMAVLIAGFAAGKADSDLVARKLNDLIAYVAPQLNQYEANKAKDTPEGDAHAAAISAASPHVNPELVTHINNFISATRSNAASGGITSAISLIVIILILFTNIEGVFNDIWGVRRGRSWVVRIVFYWTILTLGAVLFFGALSAIAVSNFANTLKTYLGEEVANLLIIALRSSSIILLIGVLTLFYRYIPNTRVFWRAALVGAVVVGLIIACNNLLASAYLSRVELTRSLYGSLALPMILMFGLYIFWLVVLIGGQISYAVQNVHYRNSQAAWNNLSASTRERLTLGVLLTISRRFQACLPPCTVAQLGSAIKVPTQIINEALNRLIDLHLVSPVPAAEDTATTEFAYQPARPLSHITLAEFKEQFESLGNDPSSEGIDRLDPLIGRYHETIHSLCEKELFAKSLQDLFTEHTFDDSTPPFALGQRPDKA